MCFVTWISKLANKSYQNKTEKTYFPFGWCLNPKALLLFSTPYQPFSTPWKIEVLTHTTQGNKIAKTQNRGFSFQFWEPNKHRLPGTFCESPCFFFPRFPSMLPRFILKPTKPKNRWVELPSCKLLHIIAYPSMSQVKVLVFDGGPPSRSL